MNSNETKISCTRCGGCRKPVQLPNSLLCSYCYDEVIRYQQGYSACSAKAEKLVEALKNLIGEVKIADNAHAYDNLHPAIDALDQWGKENDNGEGK